MGMGRGREYCTDAGYASALAAVLHSRESLAPIEAPFLGEGTYRLDLSTEEARVSRLEAPRWAEVEDGLTSVEREWVSGPPWEPGA